MKLQICEIFTQKFNLIKLCICVKFVTSKNSEKCDKNFLYKRRETNEKKKLHSNGRKNARLSV